QEGLRRGLRRGTPNHGSPKQSPSGGFPLRGNQPIENTKSSPRAPDPQSLGGMVANPAAPDRGLRFHGARLRQAHPWARIFREHSPRPWSAAPLVYGVGDDRG